jgi:hypothetical protein
MVFFTPMLPVSYHLLAYNILFSFVFILSALSLQHVGRRTVGLMSLFLVSVTWAAFGIDLPGLLLASRTVQGLFFIFIVVSLIRQTAATQNVSVRVIADSINGYLLVGVIYSTVVYSVVRLNPETFHFPEGESGNEVLMSKMFYYTFVTYTSTGYGDITPVSPGSRSFATLISATGQMYVAIIIALLVGKFSSLGTKN